MVAFTWMINLVPGFPLLFDRTIEEAFEHGCDGCFKPMLNVSLYLCLGHSLSFLQKLKNFLYQPSWVWSQVTMAFLIPSLIMVVIWANMVHIMALETTNQWDTSFLSDIWFFILSLFSQALQGDHSQGDGYHWLLHALHQPVLLGVHHDGGGRVALPLLLLRHLLTGLGQQLHPAFHLCLP